MTPSQAATFVFGHTREASDFTSGMGCRRRILGCAAESYLGLIVC